VRPLPNSARASAQTSAAWLLAACLLVCSDTWAAEPLPRAKVPPPPPPPSNYEPDPAEEAEVVVIERANERVEEVRVRGRLIMLRVTPSHGRPYFLYYGDGGPQRLESLDEGLKVPQWLLRKF